MTRTRNTSWLLGMAMGVAPLLAVVNCGPASPAPRTASVDRDAASVAPAASSAPPVGLTPAAIDQALAAL